MDHKMNDPKKRKADHHNPTAKKAKKNDSKKGDDAVNFLMKLVLAIGGWEVEKMGEGTAADCAIRREGSDLWIPVQVKSCSTGKGKFKNLKGNYKNMIMCLVELEKDGNNVWMGRWDNFPATQVGDIRGKKRNWGGKTTTYEPYRVQDDLNARLHSLDADPQITKWPLADLNVSTTPNTRKERLSTILFASILAGSGLKMQQPEYENTATDWFLKGSRFQDKTAGGLGGSQFHIGLRKSAGYKNGKQQHQPYRVGDNNFYIVFIRDKQYTDKFMKNLSLKQFHELCSTASLKGCYLFSEAELIASGHIATDDQPGKVTLYLPVPNLDGSFEPEPKRPQGGKKRRTHTFQPNYFHKDRFQELIDRMIF